MGALPECARSCSSSARLMDRRRLRQPRQQGRRQGCRIRDTFMLEDRNGHEVAEIKERKLSLRDTMTVERDGETMATVHKALVGFRDRFKSRSTAART